ncbi:uncharacterized protein DS421_18g625950 [Arachis hypogaea]|nr:uncharacterized protein DS421_18g625950 [Arachis hypogaea]
MKLREEGRERNAVAHPRVEIEREQAVPLPPRVAVVNAQSSLPFYHETRSPEERKGRRHRQGSLPSQLPSPLATATNADHPCAASQAEPRPGESASHSHRWRRRSARGEGEATAVAGTSSPRRRRARHNLCRRQSDLLCHRAVEEKAIQSHRIGETERSTAEPEFSHRVQPHLRRRCRLDRNYRRQKGVSGRRECRCRRRELHLCDSDHQGWSCDFRNCCRSSGLSFCHLRPCCRRRKSLPVKVLIEVSAFLDFEKVLMLRDFYS